MSKRKKCPKCKSNENVIKIVYGTPDFEILRADKEGKIRSGGCIVYDNSPNWYCKKCDYEF